ncbi:MAG TPA: tetratricopeptide repeat protein [Candidatus Lokiarchaeia archaeon]|nr:tetratricopeptide repeat protein [Candidatus Lokiarchaeia archaeon]
MCEELKNEILRLERETKRTPRNFDLWRSLGHKLLDDKQPELAFDAFSKALEIKPDNDDVSKIVDFCRRDIEYLRRSSD